MKKRLVVCLVYLISIASGQAQFQNKGPSLPVEKTGYVQSKNFYFLTLLQRDTGIRKALAEDPVLAGIATAKTASLRNSLERCQGNTLCYSEGMLFDDAEIKRIGNRLKELYQSNKALTALVSNKLRSSGTYQMYQAKGGGDLLVKAWEQDARAINHTINVYARGKKPNYPKIDSTFYRPASREFLANIYTVNLIVLDKAEKTAFFESPMQYALQLIEMNGMDRAGDFEPMHMGVNRAAYQRAKDIKWSDYKYTAMLIPGAGPETLLEALSMGGYLRCRLALAEYKKGLAPFIIVSGGNVHPYKTPYNEAVEMKKQLMKLGVPENAIIMDPHARHTTTNMRNAARLMYYYGIPLNKTAVVVSVPSQVTYIEDEKMQKRCVQELGYSPFKKGLRLAPHILEFVPLYNALQIDEDEPLDP